MPRASLFRAGSVASKRGPGALTRSDVSVTMFIFLSRSAGTGRIPADRWRSDARTRRCKNSRLAPNRHAASPVGNGEFAIGQCVQPGVDRHGIDVWLRVWRRNFTDALIDRRPKTFIKNGGFFHPCRSQAIIL